MLTKFTIGITILLSVSTNAARSFAFPTLKTLDRSCRTNDNQNGWCRNFADCSSKSLTGANKFPKICGFNHGSKTPVICCPVTLNFLKTNKTGSITLTRIEAPVTSFDCGFQGTVEILSFFENQQSRKTSCTTDYEYVSGIENTPQRIKRSKIQDPVRVQKRPEVKLDEDIFALVGSVDVSISGTWPWMALLGRNNGDAVNYFCDGVLINEQFVLTAAHCLLDGENFFIRLGEHNFEIESSATPFNVEFEKLDIYPEYKLNQGHHDLALIKLAQKVTIKNDVRPVCLPWGTPANIDLLGKCVTVTGWGANMFGGRSTPHLQEVNVEVFDSTDCHKSYSSLSNFNSTFPKGMNFENTLCAGDKEGGKDACQGDSGGPLVHFDNGKWFLGGIISKGYGCGHPDYPGLYAPIRNLDYLQWIKDIAFS